MGEADFVVDDEDNVRVDKSLGSSRLASSMS